MDAQTIRRKYIEFFQSKGHAHIPSASLVPDDQTVLFTTAGMHPLVPYLMGEEHPAGKRLVDHQKCVRTNDIDEVGDATHLTFFEMLGNWSLGDYFKQEAIAWSFEFLTDPKWLGLPLEKLAVSVFQGDEDAPRDEEAAGFWAELGIPTERIVYLPKTENWWGPAGETGPCGPDTEMFYYIPDGNPPSGSNPETDEDSWVEIWNDVFMQYNKTPDGSFVPLSQQNVDTGMGLERIVAVLQGKKNVYETDLFQPIIQTITELVGQDYTEDTQQAIRIIADHLRAATFMTADGVVPDNLHRGYVLRRLIRRALAQARVLGFEGALTTPLAEVVIAHYGAAYPELNDNRATILSVLSQEEETFGQTLSRGLRELQKVLDETGGDTIPGKDAFMLHDTYGFPIELTQEFANERGLVVDMQGFEREFEKQQARSRAGSGFTLGKTLEETFADTPKTSFTGYEKMSDSARVVQIEQHDEEVQVVLDQTPFYAESGGQTGDRGLLIGPNGKVNVRTTKKTKRDVFIHIGTLEGELKVGDTVEANVDIPSREQIMRYHTGTHLLHQALREVLGEHVEQRGSSITDKRLRFDFVHPEPMTADQKAEVERKMNAWIQADYPVSVRQTSLDEAKAQGAMALFEGKYDQTVRLVEIGQGVSRELCGGTHVSHTGEIKQLRIKKEQSSSQGIRRIKVV